MNKTLLIAIPVLIPPWSDGIDQKAREASDRDRDHYYRVVCNSEHPTNSLGLKDNFYLFYLSNKLTSLKSNCNAVKDYVTNLTAL